MYDLNALKRFLIFSRNIGLYKAHFTARFLSYQRNLGLNFIGQLY